MSLLHRSTRFRTAALVAATAATLVAAPVAASGAHAAPVPPDAAHSGLFGSSDPTYDGVFRQSLAILGIHAAGEAVDDAAVTWLEDQQCADGGFTSFNPSPDQPCPAYDGTTFTGGEDVDSTALAAQALRALGHTGAASDAEAWIVDAQSSADGGWESPVGSGFGTNPNSSGLALMALHAAGLTPTKDPAPYFAGLQIGRTALGAGPADHGSIAASFDPTNPNLVATLQSIPGLAGSDLVDVASPSLATWQRDVTAPVTTPAADASHIADWAATWLAAQNTDPTYNVGYRAWSVLSFAAAGTGRAAAEDLYANLRTHAVGTNAGQLGLAALAATAMRESTDAQEFASLAAATLTPSTGLDAGVPSTWTLTPTTAWIGQKVTVSNPYAGTTLPVTQKVSWGDDTSSMLSGASATHTYAAAGSFRPVVSVAYGDYARAGDRVLPTVHVKKDTVRPVVSLTVPKSPQRVSSWHVIRGTASDKGLGVAKVTVSLVREHAGAWYSYSGSGWTKRPSYAAAVSASARVGVAVSATGHWSRTIGGLDTGELRIRYTATDRAGNTSATTSVTAKPATA